MAEFWYNFFSAVLHVALFFVCAFLILLVLMQRSRQEGIGATFGAETTQVIFGAQTSEVLTKLTVYCTVLFFVLTLALSAMTSLHAKYSTAAQLAVQPIIPSKGDAFDLEDFEQALQKYLVDTGILPTQSATSLESDNARWQDIPIPAPSANP